jgi:AraC-like DNA-binding protein
VLKLEMPIIRELLSQEEIHAPEQEPDRPAMATGETTAELLDACARLVSLLDKPQDIPFLSSLIQREIIYRILRGPEGARLRAIATLGDQSQRAAKAIAWVRTNYATPVPVEDLAKIASMGVSTLHHHFRTLTAVSPLQFQKQLRLHAVRERMLIDGLDAAKCGIRGWIRKCQPVQSRVRSLLWPAADAGHSDSALARSSAVGIAQSSPKLCLSIPNEHRRR